MADDRLTRESAIDALRAAAAWRGVPAAALSLADYRAYRHHVWDERRPPSELAITLLFGGWGRACDRAADASGEPVSRSTP